MYQVSRIYLSTSCKYIPLNNVSQILQPQVTHSAFFLSRCHVYEVSHSVCPSLLELPCLA